MTSLLLLVACWGTGEPGLPKHPVTLRGAGVLGVVSGAEGCRIGLWGPVWGTPGATVVACSVEADPNGVWLRFPFETASSEGEGSLHLELGVGRARMHLGAREGEHELVLGVEEAPRSREAEEEAAAATSAAIETWRKAWQAGSFWLQSGDRGVGELQFRADLPAQVQLYDVGWMTPGTVDALQLDEGPDLLLIFDAEPSLDEQPSILRINRPTNQAVVPLGQTPSPVEKTYQLVPGTVAEAERQEARALALLAAGQRELEVGLMLAVALAEAASATFFNAPGENCPTLMEVGEDWPVLFTGYDVTLVKEGDGCGVRMEPTRIQHGRRLAATVGPDGIVRESLLRGI